MAADFSAHDYAAERDEKDITVEIVLSRFPDPHVVKKAIDEVEHRLASVRMTYDPNSVVGFSDERIALHNAIIRDVLSEEAVESASPDDDTDPILVMLGGRGGSGKSWFRNRVYFLDTAIVIDPDEIKSRLPEYEGWNAAQVHEESTFIVSCLVEAARTAGCNVVIDRTMSSFGTPERELQAFLEEGYRFQTFYMFLPRQKAAERAIRRFMGEHGRYVPIHVVLANTDNERVFDSLRTRAEDWAFYDNDVDFGAAPIPVASKDS